MCTSNFYMLSYADKWEMSHLNRYMRYINKPSSRKNVVNIVAIKTSVIIRNNRQNKYIIYINMVFKLNIKLHQSHDHFLILDVQCINRFFFFFFFLSSSRYSYSINHLLSMIRYFEIYLGTQHRQCIIYPSV